LAEGILRVEETSWTMLPGRASTRSPGVALTDVVFDTVMV